MKNIIISILFLGLMTGCAPRKAPVMHPLLSGLVGRGPVTLSTENPYIAANLFLSRQMEKSPELKGFVEFKGAPSAIEVLEGQVSDTAIAFYYPQTNESFELEETQNMWVIRGPFALQREKQRELSVATKAGGAKPEGTFVALEQMASKEDQARARAALVPFESPGEAHSLLPGTTGLKQSLDEMKIKEFLSSSEHSEAELTPKGDLVHYVAEDDETIEAIARWYSFDSSNSDKLARINRVKGSEKLEVGETIVVPSYMVKNTARLDESALKILIQ